MTKEKTEERIEHQNRTQERKTTNKTPSKLTDNNKNENFKFFNNIDEENLLVGSSITSPSNASQNQGININSIKQQLHSNHTSYQLDDKKSHSKTSNATNDNQKPNRTLEHK